MRPDSSRHPGRWDIGILGLHEDGADAALEVRAFFTEGDEPLREDPVTGSLNAAAAEWLTARGSLSAPYVAAQGTAMGRRGRVHVSADDDGLWIGGRTDVVISGSIRL